MTKAKEHRSKAVQRKIYSCAIDLFQKNGFENVKVNDICAAADVSTGTFYYYYPSKESIFLGSGEAIDEIIDENMPELKGTTASETLKNLLLFKLKTSTRTGAETSKISWIAELKHNKDVALDMRRTAYGYYMNTIEEGMKSGEFRDDINLYTATSMLRYMAGGLCLRWAIQPDVVDLDVEGERLVDMFISLLKPCGK